MNKNNIKKYLLIDGQELDKVKHKYLYELFMSNDIDIFNKTNKKLTLKYVGYIEVIIDSTIHELYCFPKEYNLCLDEQDYSDLSTESFNVIKEQFSQVVRCVYKAKTKSRAQGKSDDVENYSSNIYYLNEIINHHQQFGNLVEIEKEYISNSSGKINWNKTIGKVIPKYINDNFIYDRFIIEKKNVNITFLTKQIAKVIKEGTIKYDFILPPIDTGIDYSDIIGYSNQHCIELLVELRNKTFKDYLHSVIDNLISYLLNETNNAEIGSIVGTNNFEYVWETLVQYGLGEHDFVTQLNKRVSADDSQRSVSINIDHFSLEQKIIVDSKYYTNANDEDSAMFDYKQLFYNYYMVYEQFMHGNDQPFTYDQLKQEYKSWTNVLVRPTKEVAGSEQQFQIIMKDGLELYTIYVNINNIIDSYINNKPNNNLILDTNFAMLVSSNQ